MQQAFRQHEPEFAKEPDRAVRWSDRRLFERVKQREHQRADKQAKRQEVRGHPFSVIFHVMVADLAAFHGLGKHVVRLVARVQRRFFRAFAQLVFQQLFAVEQLLLPVQQLVKRVVQRALGIRGDAFDFVQLVMGQLGNLALGLIELLVRGFVQALLQLRQQCLIFVFRDLVQAVRHFRQQRVKLFFGCFMELLPQLWLQLVEFFIRLGMELALHLRLQLIQLGVRGRMDAADDLRQQLGVFVVDEVVHLLLQLRQQFIEFIVDDAVDFIRDLRQFFVKPLADDLVDAIVQLLLQTGQLRIHPIDDLLLRFLQFGQPGPDLLLLVGRQLIDHRLQFFQHPGKRIVELFRFCLGVRHDLIDLLIDFIVHAGDNIRLDGVTVLVDRLVDFRMNPAAGFTAVLVDQPIRFAVQLAADLLRIFVHRRIDLLVHPRADIAAVFGKGLVDLLVQHAAHRFGVVLDRGVDFVMHALLHGTGIVRDRLVHFLVQARIDRVLVCGDFLVDLFVDPLVQLVAVFVDDRIEPLIGGAHRRVDFAVYLLFKLGNAVAELLQARFQLARAVAGVAQSVGHLGQGFEHFLRERFGHFRRNFLLDFFHDFIGNRSGQKIVGAVFLVHQLHFLRFRVKDRGRGLRRVRRNFNQQVIVVVF